MSANAAHRLVGSTLRGARAASVTHWAEVCSTPSGLITPVALSLRKGPSFCTLKPQAQLGAMYQPAAVLVMAATVPV